MASPEIFRYSDLLLAVTILTFTGLSSGSSPGYMPALSGSLQATHATQMIKNRHIFFHQSMDASRTFTKKLKLLCISILFCVSISQIATIQIRYGNRAELKNIEIRFQLPGSFSTTETEKQITSVLENILASIDGIRNINSVSGTGYGSILLELKNHEAAESVMARIEREFEIHRARLPKGIIISQPVLKNEEQMTLLLGTGFYQNEDLRSELVNHLSALAGITSLEWQGLPEEYTMAEIKQPYATYIKKTLPSSRISVNPFQFGSFKLIPEKEESGLVRIGHTGYKTEEIIEYKPQTFNVRIRWNGMPSIMLMIRNRPSTTAILRDHLVKWKKYNSNQIKIQNLPVILRAHQLPYFPDLILLVLVILIYGKILRQPYSLRKFACCIILAGISLIILKLLPVIDQPTLLLHTLCLAGGFFGIHSNVQPKILRALILCGVPITIFTFVLNQPSCLLLLFIPTGALLPSIFTGDQLSKLHKPYSPLKNKKAAILLGILPLMVWIQWKLENSYDKQTRENSDLTVSDSEVESLDIHLFFNGELALDEMNSYVDLLDRKVRNLARGDANLYSSLFESGHAHIHLESRRIDADIRRFLIKKALSTSGILWFISQGDNEFSNSKRPIFPRHHWKFRGYNLDSLQTFTDSIFTLLQRTPRVMNVVYPEDTWIPTRRRPSENYYWINKPQNISGFGPVRMVENAENKLILTTPLKAKDEILNAIYKFPERSYRGYQLFEVDERSGPPEIHKENRQFVVEIAHDFSGTDKMNRDFLSSTEKKIAATLPEGIKLMKKENSFLHSELIQYGMLKIVLIYFICTVIMRNRLSAGLIESLRFMIFYILFQSLYMVINGGLPEGMMIIPFIIMLRCLLCSGHMYRAKPGLFLIVLPMGILYTSLRELPDLLSAGLSCLLLSELIILRDWRLILTKFLPLLPWHDRRFFRMN